MNAFDTALPYGFHWFPNATGVTTEATLVNIVLFGVVFGSAAAIVFTLVVASQTPIDSDSGATPLGLLATNRTTVTRQITLIAPLALTIGFGGRLAADLLQSLLGPLNWPLIPALIIAGVGGLSGALCYVLAFTAWGQWAVIARI